MYKVIKVLNNNTILATNGSEEAIIMYKGIGLRYPETQRSILCKKDLMPRKNLTR